VIEYDHAAGNGFCVSCGTVVEENTIVNEIAFGETANGAAIVQGSFVAQGASGFPSWYHSLVEADTVVLAHARMGGPYGNRSSGDSREQTIENGVSFVDILKIRFNILQQPKGSKTLQVFYACQKSLLWPQDGCIHLPWNTNSPKGEKA